MIEAQSDENTKREESLRFFLNSIESRLKTDIRSELGIEVEELIVPIGNPVEEIIEAGPNYSLIVMSESSKSGLHRFFMGSVAFKVMENAHNSVLVAR